MGFMAFFVPSARRDCTEVPAGVSQRKSGRNCIATLLQAYPFSVRGARFSFQFPHFIFIAAALAFS
jgi:hypothetical protein